MVEYNKGNVKLLDLLLNKRITAVKNGQDLTLRINIKMFNGNNLHLELSLATRKKAQLKNTFENNMSTDIKLTKAQISKIIQSGGFLDLLLNKMARPLTIVAVPLSNFFLAPLWITAAASEIEAGIKKDTWF